MKTLDLFWMRPCSWALIFIGEGAQATVVDGKFVPQELHDGMCGCKADVQACDDDGVKEILEEMKDSKNWSFDERHEPFQFHHDSEIGGVMLVHVRSIKHGGMVIL